MLKRFLLCALMLCSTSQAGELFQTDYRKAYRQAINDGKPLLVVVGADWCAPCKLYKNELKALEPAEMECVVAVYMDHDADPALAKMLSDSTSLPTTVLFVKQDGVYRKLIANGFFSLATFREKFLKPCRSGRAAD